MKNFLTFSEVVLIISGFLVLVSAVAIYTTGSFALFTTAKVLYALGVLLLLFRR